MNILIKKFGDKNKYITFIKEYKYKNNTILIIYKKINQIFDFRVYCFKYTKILNLKLVYIYFLNHLFE